MPDLAALSNLIDRFVARQMKPDGTPGVAVAVTGRDELLDARAYGLADLAAQRPVAPETTLFEIGSIGKSFTAVLALQLSDEGLLDLDQPVTRYLPWFDVQSQFEPITLHHLLSHTAGIVACIDGTADGRSEVWALRETVTGSPPGSRFHYSNVGYKAIGYALARMSGQSYGDLLLERILKPLEMTSSEPTITYDNRQRLAVGYSPWYDDRPPLPEKGVTPAMWLETDTADGSIATPVTDLAAFARMILRRGEGPRGRLLSDSGFVRLTTPVALAEDDFWYGYGVMVRQEAGHTIVGHPGGMIGYAASLQVDLDAGVGVTVLVNGPGAPNLIGRFVLAAARAALEGKPLPALPEDAAPDAEGMAAYVGIYRCVSERDRPSIEVLHDGSSLALQGVEGGRLIPYFSDDTFVVSDAAWDRYQMRFERDDEGRVRDLVHGSDQYRRVGMDDEPFPPAPDAWYAYAGHYRSHNPWATNVRVVLRRGTLWLVCSEAPDGFEDEAPLVPLGDATFRVGDDPGGPERIRFTAIVEGEALEAVLSGCPYYRFFTP